MQHRNVRDVPECAWVRKNGLSGALTVSPVTRWYGGPSTRGWSLVGPVVLGPGIVAGSAAVRGLRAVIIGGVVRSIPGDRCRNCCVSTHRCPVFGRLRRILVVGEARVVGTSYRHGAPSLSGGSRSGPDRQGNRHTRCPRADGEILQITQGCERGDGHERGASSASTCSSTRPRSTSVRWASARWRRTYSALPAGVSIGTTP